MLNYAISAGYQRGIIAEHASGICVVSASKRQVTMTIEMALTGLISCLMGMTFLVLFKVMR